MLRPISLGHDIRSQLKLAKRRRRGRTDGGQRRYRPEDIQTVFTIKRLVRDEMFSIAGARRYLAKQRQTEAA